MLSRLGRAVAQVVDAARYRMAVQTSYLRPLMVSHPSWAVMRIPCVLFTCGWLIYVYSMRMKAHDVIRALEADGWYEVRSKGSHRHFRHPTKPGTTTVPVHGARDLSPQLLRDIERQSGTKLRRN